MCFPSKHCFSLWISLTREEGIPLCPMGRCMVSCMSDPGLNRVYYMHRQTGNRRPLQGQHGPESVLWHWRFCEKKNFTNIHGCMMVCDVVNWSWPHTEYRLDIQYDSKLNINILDVCNENQKYVPVQQQQEELVTIVSNCRCSGMPAMSCWNCLKVLGIKWLLVCKKTQICKAQLVWPYRNSCTDCKCAKQNKVEWWPGQLIEINTEE